VEEERPLAQPPTADPAPLGLSAFAATTLVFSFVNAGIIQQGADPGQQITNLFLPMALAFGGLAQLIAGILEFRTGNTFALTGFGSFGAFWIALAIMNLMARQGVIAETRLAEAQGWFFLAFTIFTFIMLIASFGLNVGLVVTFLLLFLTLLLLTIADLNGGPEAGGIALTFVRLGGYVGIITALAAFYVAAADVINDTMGRDVLPLGPLGGGG
jgi:succinate-acetate transporter protein